MSSWLRPFLGPNQDVAFLIVTGNYSKPRILAELIQKTTGQPILLLPFVSENGSQNIFFMPPDNRGKALTVPYNAMTNFINFLNPKMIIVLGNQNYVPDVYYKMIPDKNKPVIRVTCDDWVKNGNILGRLLNLSNLGSDYEKLLKELQDNTNYQRESSAVVNHAPQTESVKVQPEVVKPPSTTPAPPTAPILTEPRIIDASQK